MKNPCEPVSTYWGQQHPANPGCQKPDLPLQIHLGCEKSSGNLVQHVTGRIHSAAPEGVDLSRMLGASRPRQPGKPAKGRTGSRSSARGPSPGNAAAWHPCPQACTALTPRPRGEDAIRSGAGGPAERDRRDAGAEPSPPGPATKPPPPSHRPSEVAYYHSTTYLIYFSSKTAAWGGGNIAHLQIHPLFCRELG